MSEPVALVLVVDDDRCTRELLQVLLENLGYKTATASSGEQALRVLPWLRPDLVLLDLHMPVLDGFTVVARMQGDPALATIPVFIYSSDVDVAPAGVAGAISKSATVKELIAAVQAFLKRPEVRR